MPRQKTVAPQRLADDERQRQNWRMGEEERVERPLIAFDDDDSYNSEEDSVRKKLFFVLCSF
jgi:hypothetical protein